MTVPASPVFKGDCESHLDLLVAVCNAPKAAPQGPLPERALVPFDFTDAAPLPCSTSSKATSRAAEKNGRSPRASPPKKPKASSPGRPGRGSTDGAMPRSPLLTTPTSESKFMSLDGVSRADIFSAARKVANATPAALLGASCASRACPGFFSSPRPSALPLPSGILMRSAATLVKC